MWWYIKTWVFSTVPHFRCQRVCVLKDVNLKGYMPLCDTFCFSHPCVQHCYHCCQKQNQTTHQESLLGRKVPVGSLPPFFFFLVAESWFYVASYIVDTLVGERRVPRTNLHSFPPPQEGVLQPPGGSMEHSGNFWSWTVQKVHLLTYWP